MHTAIYVRVSTDDQNVEMQIKEIQEYLASKGDFNTKIYQDIGLSGANPNRPALKQLLNDCKQGSIALVIVWKLDRLFRSLSHLISTLKTFEDQKVKFISVRDNLDLTTPSGVLMMHLIGAFSQFERDLIAMRVKSGMANAKAKGIHCGRPRASSPFAEEILTLRASGMTFRAIAKTTGVTLSSVQRVLAK